MVARKIDIHDKYTYRVTWSEEDSEYVGLCAELPSLSWLAQTPEAALKGVSKLVGEVVEDLRHNNEPIPEPIAVRQFSGKFMIRVPPEVPFTACVRSTGLTHGGDEVHFDNKSQRELGKRFAAEMQQLEQTALPCLEEAWPVYDTVKKTCG